MQYNQDNPPRSIEMVMLLLAIALLGIWGKTEQWPYLVLSLSYAIGSSTSLLIRESFFPSSQPRLTLPQIAAIVLLIVSIYGFTDLARYF